MWQQFGVFTLETANGGNVNVDHGVLVLTANGLLRLLPPLNIPWDELKEAIGIVKKVIDK